MVYVCISLAIASQLPKLLAHLFQLIFQLLDFVTPLKSLSCFQSGIAYCVEAKTGERVYRERVPGVQGGKGIKFFASNLLLDDSDFHGTPAISGDQLFIRSNRFLNCISN